MKICHYEVSKVTIKAKIEYSRQVLSVYSGFSPNQTKIHLPEIDGLTLLNLASSSSFLFNDIKSFCGDKSYIINHFAACEKPKQFRYTDPVFDGLGLFEKFETMGPSESNSLYVYVMKGGTDMFQRLLNDPFFLPYVLEACREGIVSIRRIDLALDVDFDLMGHLRTQLDKGLYWSPGRRPVGYIDIPGGEENILTSEFPRINKPVSIGRDSSLLKTLRKKGLNYRLKTAYFGYIKKHEISFCIYDKRAQMLETEFTCSEISSRLEVRLVQQKESTPEFQALMLTILSSYMDSQEGWITRTKLFLKAFVENLSFTSNASYRSKDHSYPTNIAPWWFSLCYSLALPLISLRRVQGNNVPAFLQPFYNYYKLNPLPILVRKSQNRQLPLGR